MKKIKLNFEKLYEIALKYHEVDSLIENLFYLHKLQKQNIYLQRFFNHKQIALEEKLTLISQLFKINTKSVFYKLIFLLLKYKLEYQIYYIYEGFCQVVEEKEAKIIVQVLTAELLDEKTQNFI